AALLERIACNLESLGDYLLERVVAESGLSYSRIVGERGRTVDQLRLFAEVVRAGIYRGVRMDSVPAGERGPVGPDIRQYKVGLGPVAVFGASNFPLAFSVAGGDTASALAAGCPVVFKAHNSHPGTSELVAGAIARAVKEADLHPGVFSMIYGPGSSIGQALASDSSIKAVGFTGSRSAGI